MASSSRARASHDSWHAGRSDPDQIDVLALGRLHDGVDALVEPRDAAVGVVGAEHQEHGRPARRLLELRERLGAADVDAELGEVLELRRARHAEPQAVAEHVGGSARRRRRARHGKHPKRHAGQGDAFAVSRFGNPPEPPHSKKVRLKKQQINHGNDVDTVATMWRPCPRLFQSRGDVAGPPDVRAACGRRKRGGGVAKARRRCQGMVDHVSHGRLGGG